MASLYEITFRTYPYIWIPSFHQTILMTLQAEHIVLKTLIRLLASQVALVVKNPPVNAGNKRHEFDPWVRKIPWSRAWQHTPVFLSMGNPHGQRSLVGYSLGSQRVRHDWSNLAHTCEIRLYCWYPLKKIASSLNAFKCIRFKIHEKWLWRGILNFNLTTKCSVYKRKYCDDFVIISFQ